MRSKLTGPGSRRRSSLLPPNTTDASTFELGALRKHVEGDIKHNWSVRVHRGQDRRNISASQESSGGIEGVYIISVAARILEMHPQTLRKYERMGLLNPFRTVGMLRLYSEEDIARLRLIKHLVGDLGLNLAGVQLAIELFNQLLDVKTRLYVLRGEALKKFLEESLDEMLELLHGRLP